MKKIIYQKPLDYYFGKKLILLKENICNIYIIKKWTPKIGVRSLYRHSAKKFLDSFVQILLILLHLAPNFEESGVVIVLGWFFTDKFRLFNQTLLRGY